MTTVYATWKSLKELKFLPVGEPDRTVTLSRSTLRFYNLDRFGPLIAQPKQVFTREQIDKLVADDVARAEWKRQRDEADRKRQEEWESLEDERQRQYKLVAEAQAHQTRIDAARLRRERQDQTDPGCPYSSLAQAFADGWVERQEYHYGGESLLLKGHNLIRNPQTAESRTHWKGQGFRVKQGQEPHAFCNSCYRTYGVYRRDQVEATRNPNVLAPSKRQAKRLPS